MYTFEQNEPSFLLTNTGGTDITYFLRNECDDNLIATDTLSASETVDFKSNKLNEGAYKLVIEDVTTETEYFLVDKNIRNEILYYIYDLICDCGTEPDNDEILELLIVYNSFYLKDPTNITDTVFNDLNCFLVEKYTVDTVLLGCDNTKRERKNLLTYIYYLINYKIESSTTTNQGKMDVDYNISMFNNWIIKNNLLPLSQISI